MISREALGIGACYYTFTAFVGLKLFGAVDWSWIWVCSPIWLPLLAASLFAIVPATIDKVIDFRK